MLVTHPLSNERRVDSATPIADVSTADRNICPRIVWHVCSFPCSFDFFVSHVLRFPNIAVYISAVNVAEYVLFGSKRHVDE